MTKQFTLTFRTETEGYSMANHWGDHNYFRRLVRDQYKCKISGYRWGDPGNLYSTTKLNFEDIDKNEFLRLIWSQSKGNKAVVRGKHDSLSWTISIEKN